MFALVANSVAVYALPSNKFHKMIERDLSPKIEAILLN